MDELACELDLLVLDDLAKELARLGPSETIQGVTYGIDESDAQLEITTGLALNRFAGEPHVCLTLGRSSSPQPYFEIAYRMSDQATRPMYETTADLQEALAVTEELASSEEILPDVKRLTEHLQNALMSAITDIPMDEFAALGPEGLRPTVPVTQVATHLVEEMNGNRATTRHEFSRQLSGGRSVRILYNRLDGAFDENARSLPPIEELSVFILDKQLGCARQYMVDEAGGRDMELSGYVNRATNEDGIDPYSVEACIAVLQEVRDAVQEGLAEPWTYPVFDFDVPVDEADSVETVTERILEALDDATWAEDIPPQPNYQFNRNKRKRIDRYLHHTVRSSHLRGEATARRDFVVGVDTAANQVLQDLMVENHPVAQVIEYLYADYGSTYDWATLQAIVTEVVLQTHWEKVREILAFESHYWRTGFVTRDTLNKS